MKTIEIVLSFVFILIIGLIYTKCEDDRQNKAIISNLPTEMVEYIQDETGYTQETMRERDYIVNYYLDNFYKLEDLAYEYHWR